MCSCANDFSYPFYKPYDLQHENFKMFALCTRSGVAMSQILKESVGARKSILGRQYWYKHKLTLIDWK